MSVTLREYEDTMTESLFAPPNWVMDRADCNLAVTFNALFSVAKRDVAEANKVEALTSPSTAFAIQRENGGIEPTFCVFRRVRGNPVQEVLFRQFPMEICIDPPNGESLTVRAQWDSGKNRCELFVNDVPYEVWQISKKALELLFFSP